MSNNSEIRYLSPIDIEKKSTNIVFNFILIDVMGVYGLALATSLVSIVNSIILYVYINKLNSSYV